MPNLLHVSLIGHLGKDPEMKTVGDKTVCEFSVGVNSSREKESDPSWFRISVWGKSGENCAKYLSKGKPVNVLGELTIRKYTDKEGKHGISYDVHADRVVFLGAKGDSPSKGNDAALPF